MRAESPANDHDAKIKVAAAEFLAITASRLSRMASSHDFPLLAHLLDQAVLEAWAQASKGKRRGSSASENGAGET